MSEKIELTAADLALYLGCECRLFNIINGVLEYERDGTLCGIRPQSIHQNRVLVNVKSEHGRIMELAYLYCEVKPILRPLSDMTEEEAREIYFLRNGCAFDPRPYYWPEGHADISALNDLREDVELYQEDLKFCIGETDVWRYLLSKHFDLFGWIPAGLALDKTKIQ